MLANIYKQYALRSLASLSHIAQSRNLAADGAKPAALFNSGQSFSAGCAMVSERSQMFARNMTLKLQPNHLMRFIQAYDAAVLSILKKQKGFRGEVAIITAMGDDVVATSYWETREAADAYHNSGYKEIVRILAEMIEDRPAIVDSEVISSTLHNLPSVL
jgi:heme-degrading monooxygenase HmoA